MNLPGLFYVSIYKYQEKYKERLMRINSRTAERVLAAETLAIWVTSHRSVAVSASCQKLALA